MSLDAWLTFVVLAVMVWALARELAAPSATVLTGVIVLLVVGVITPAEAFAGLSNPAPITVAALYVLARAVEKTGALQRWWPAPWGLATGEAPGWRGC